MPMETGQSPPPPWPWGADLKAGFWWTGVGGSGLGDPPRWAHLFVHLDVQPGGTLRVLGEREEHQWGKWGGGDPTAGMGWGDPNFATLPTSCSTQMRLIWGQNIRCGGGGVTGAAP